MIRTRRFTLTAVAVAALASLAAGTFAIPALAQAVKAALVRDVDNPALGAVQLPLTLLPNNQFHDHYDATYVVPAGKRFVVQRVDVDDFAASATPGFFQVNTTFSSTSSSFSTAMQGAAIQIGVFQGPIYADPSSTVTVSYYPGQTSNAASKSSNLTGYLVSYP